MYILDHLYQYNFGLDEKNIFRLNIYMQKSNG